VSGTTKKLYVETVAAFTAALNVTVNDSSTPISTEPVSTSAVAVPVVDELGPVDEHVIKKKLQIITNKIFFILSSLNFDAL